MFESLVITELFKSHYNAVVRPDIYFWRDSAGKEIDCLVDQGIYQIPIEIKSGTTISSSFFDAITYWNTLAEADPARSYVVYAGTEHQKRTQGNVVPWTAISDIIVPR